MTSPCDQEEPLLRQEDHVPSSSINQGPDDHEGNQRRRGAPTTQREENSRSDSSDEDDAQQGVAIEIPIPAVSDSAAAASPSPASAPLAPEPQRSGTRVRSDTLLATILAKEINPNAVDTIAGELGGEGGARRRNLHTPLGFLYQLFKSLPMQVVMVLLTFVDISFLLYEFITSDVQYAVVTLSTSLMFVLEVLVLWSFLGTAEYFRNDKWWVVAEVLIVTVSFLIEYAEYIIESTLPNRDFAGDLRYLRAARFLRALIIWKTRYRNFTAALRQLVSADRRRYVKDGYDLDLTYVHPKVIAMSWPSSNSESLYRNQIDNVAAFLDEKHPQHYRVFNLCSERAYDESKFHYQCTRYRIDDHSPPELQVMLTFTKEVHGFIQRDPRRNVAVIHCKGGKGRTGTMVCAYLLYAGVKDTAASALGHFGLIRTSDEAKSFQGVESPAQERYVHYFERLLKLPSGPESLPLVAAKFTRFTLHGVPFAWWSTGGLDRLWFALIAAPSTQRRVIYKSNPTVNFNGQLPANPFKKKKTRLGERSKQPLQSPRASMSPQEGETSPRGPSMGGQQEDDDDDIRQENVYSDAEEPTTAQVFGAGVVPAGTQLYFNPDAVEGGGSCQPYSSNMSIFVNGNIADPMDFDTFEERYVLAGGDTSRNAASSRYLTPMNNTNGAAGSPGSGGSSRMFRADGATPGRSVRRNVDKTLNVSVSFDVREMPAFDKDLNIRFFFNQDDPNTLQCSLQTFFHTSFEDHNFLRLSKGQLDGPHKEAHKEKKFPKTIELDLQWERVE